MKVEAIEFKNVKDKVSYWLKVSQGEKSHLMNIGEKTYRVIKEMQGADVPEMPKLPFEEPKAAPKKQAPAKSKR